MHEHYELLSKQIYARAWLDNTFKYILSHERVRNRFLSLVLGGDIQSSTLDHTSLNPVRDNDKTYLWLSKSSSQSFERDWLDLIKKHASHKEHEMAELLFHLQELKQYYPKPKHDTTLDIVCYTQDKIIDVEIQTSHQYYWEQRLVIHLAGLINQHFPGTLMKSKENTASRKSPKISLFQEPEFFSLI